MSAARPGPSTVQGRVARLHPRKDRSANGEDLRRCYIGTSMTMLLLFEDLGPNNPFAFHHHNRNRGQRVNVL
jgi:hypothetical protein